LLQCPLLKNAHLLLLVAGCERSACMRWPLPVLHGGFPNVSDSCYVHQCIIFSEQFLKKLCRLLPSPATWNFFWLCIGWTLNLCFHYARFNTGLMLLSVAELAGIWRNSRSRKSWVTVVPLPDSIFLLFNLAFWGNGSWIPHNKIKAQQA